MTSVEQVVQTQLAGLDSDILAYLVGALENMSVTERRSAANLAEVVEPFLLDTEFCSADEAARRCTSLAVAFGGSGVSKGVHIDEDTQPTLLAAPVKMSDHSDLTKTRHTYGSAGGDGPEHTGLVGNTNLEISAVPVTQKQMRRMRKENEQLGKLLRLEALQREREEEELRAARMNAIKASRAAGRQANTGVVIERFSLPHPSGTGDLLTDASLSLSRQRRYGLIGRNGTCFLSRMCVCLCVT